jgi:hypothetical protein
MLPGKQALAAALRALFGLGRAQRRGPLYREEPTSFENLRSKRHAGYSTTLVGAVRNAVEPTSSVIERRAATFPLYPFSNFVMQICYNLQPADP